MDINLVGMRALVCGSTAGIGRAAAVELAKLGAQLTLFARNREKLDATAGDLPDIEGGAHGVLQADFHDPDSVKRAIHGAVEGDDGATFHILVNNTGGPPAGQAIDADPEDFAKAFRLHLLANQIITQAVVPGMKRAQYGRIINVISTSVKQPIPGLGVSNTIRGAVASWAKTLSQELGPHHITVNNVLPGFTDTERLGSLIETKAGKGNSTPDAVAEEMRRSVPLGRFARPDEVGAAIAFLATPAAGYINGINLPVDGGRLGTL
ncbi:MAG: SDR family oxidoreductase [Phycisphaerales bacterium]